MKVTVKCEPTTFVECAKIAKKNHRRFGRQKWGDSEALHWDGEFLKLHFYGHFGNGKGTWEAIDYCDIVAEDWVLK